MSLNIKFENELIENTNKELNTAVNRHSEYLSEFEKSEDKLQQLREQNEALKKVYAANNKFSIQILQRHRSGRLKYQASGECFIDMLSRYR